MTWREFEKAYNVRLAEKCCASCKHGDVCYEGEANCNHPFVRGELPRGGMIDDVCDLWEKKGGAECGN